MQRCIRLTANCQPLIKLYMCIKFKLPGYWQSFRVSSLKSLMTGWYNSLADFAFRLSMRGDLGDLLSPAVFSQCMSMLCSIRKLELKCSRLLNYRTCDILFKDFVILHKFPFKIYTADMFLVQMCDDFRNI